MFEGKHLLIAAGIGFLFIFLVGATGNLFADCGECMEIGSWECENVLGMGEECHGWEDGGQESPDPRCEDPHTPLGDYYVGTGLCSEEHPGSCGNPGCAGEDLEDHPCVAVTSSNGTSVEFALLSHAQTWVELRERPAVIELLNQCAGNRSGDVWCTSPPVLPTPRAIVWRER